MRGWLVNDRLTAIPGTRTLWHHLLDALPGLETRCTGSFQGLAMTINNAARMEHPDYVIRNAAYFQPLEVECPVISFVQDILEGYMRDILIDVCAASRLVVFNSEYTRDAYPELHTANHRIIPVGTDDATFLYRETAPTRGVLWVGSGHPVKGFDLACRLAEESKRPWTFVMKDDTRVPACATRYASIKQSSLATLASLSAVGVCTSRVETQHLAGTEMGMCGVPVVATSVGVYRGRQPGPWGMVTTGDWHADIEAAASLERATCAAYWRDEGFGLANCMAMWRSVVESLEVAHAR